MPTMVPVQTIIALLALLVMMSSCSQTPPPHSKVETTTSSQTENTNTVQPRHPDPVITTDGSPSPSPSGYIDSETMVNTAGAETVSGTLTLWGTDAEKVYKLMAVTATPMPAGHHPTSLLKQGSQFDCERKYAGFSCSFAINFADGAIPEVMSRDDVSYFDSEIPQVQGITNFLRIEDPATLGKKVRLFVPGIQAKMIYEALQVSEIQLVANTTYSAGSQKDAASVRCLKQTLADGGAVQYSCYLYLDVSVGSIDKPPVNL